MRTTPISKIPSFNLLHSHNTIVPSYEFDVDFVGTGVDAFFGQISKKQAIRFKDRDQAGLNNLVKPYNVIGTPQGLPTEIPGWARQGRFVDYQGVDALQRFRVTVRNDADELLFDSGDGLYTIADAVDDDANISRHYDPGAYLFAADEYPIHVRFSVKSHKPFDPGLVDMQCNGECGLRLITRFDYDGQIIKPTFLSRPYADPRDRVVKILFH